MVSEVWLLILLLDLESLVSLQFICIHLERRNTVSNAFASHGHTEIQHLEDKGVERLQVLLCPGSELKTASQPPHDLQSHCLSLLWIFDFSIRSEL